MNILAKQTFTSEIELAVGNFLTVTDTKKVTDVVTDKLSGYEMTENKSSEIDSDSMDFLNLFLDAKIIEGRSEKTVERYSYILERMIQDVGCPVEKITKYHIRTYLMSLKEHGLQDSSIEGVRACISSFFTWLWKEGLIQRNPCANIAAIKCQRKIRQPFSEMEIAKIKESCHTLRDKALISFLLSTGCRISEICALNRDDVDFKELECKVLGKGNKERTVYINSECALALKNYINARTDDSPALFEGRGTKRLGPHGARFALKLIEDESGVVNIHPHRFRRTLATSLINHGMPIQEVAFVLGHEKLDTTMRYVYMEKNNVKNSYRKYA